MQELQESKNRWKQHICAEVRENHTSVVEERKNAPGM